MTRLEWNEIERHLHDPTIQLVMRGRCEEQGHQWENCMTPFFAIYERCKWCREQK